MKPAKDIKKYFQKSTLSTNPDKHEAVFEKIASAHEQSNNQKPELSRLSLGRIIMKSKITKIAATIAFIISVLIGINILRASPVWAIDQTVEALGKIQTLVITGFEYWSDGPIPFTLWARLPENNEDSLYLRMESEKIIIVIQDTQAYTYRSQSNTVTIYSDVTKSRGMMRDLDYWYKIAEFNPWITGKVLATLQLFADDWQEEYGQFEDTGRDCVFVTCGYEPLSSSFWFVCDIETKLIREGKFWRNSERKGLPVCHAVSFEYNQEIDDEVFNFVIPKGARVVTYKEMLEINDLYSQAGKLKEENKIEQAIEKYMQVYENYPNHNMEESALFMIGNCYQQLGQYEKAIDTYLKSINESENVNGITFTTYYQLGTAYKKIGQDDKALEAFEKSNIIREDIGMDKTKSYLPNNILFKFIKQSKKQ